MPKWTIKELCQYQGNDTVLKSTTFLFGNYYDPPTEEEAEDLRPGWAKEYVSAVYDTFHQSDFMIGEKYADWVLIVEADTIERAYQMFRNWCTIFTITHRIELDMVYKALRTEFNPLENYDRIENTDVRNETLGNAKTQTSPDDSENFFNVGNADSYASGTTGTTSHIHGNIGVTEAVTMIDHTVNYFGDNSMYDYLIERLINDCCYLVDYGNNAI